MVRIKKLLKRRRTREDLTQAQILTLILVRTNRIRKLILRLIRMPRRQPESKRRLKDKLLNKLRRMPDRLPMLKIRLIIKLIRRPKRLTESKRRLKGRLPIKQRRTPKRLPNS